MGNDKKDYNNGYGNEFSDDELWDEEFMMEYLEDEGNPRRKSRKKNSSGKKINIIAYTIVGIGVLCLAVGGGILISNTVEARKNQEQMDALRHQVELDAQLQKAQDESLVNESSVENTPTSQVEPSEPQEKILVKNPYTSSFLQNEDMAAWIKIEDTKIDYPVMQTMEDENYYLYRGFEKEDTRNGSLILDTDSVITEPLSTNQIIHGHNMKSGAMFAGLKDYEDQSYAEAHKYIKLYTKECERNYEVIAVFRTQVYKKTDDVFKFYKFFQADTQEEFDDWYHNIIALSDYETDLTAEFGDRFITLSTCVYHVENGRLVVVGKEIEPGDYYEEIQ